MANRGRCHSYDGEPYLLHFGVLLYVDLLAPVVLQLHNPDGVQRDATGQLGPAAQHFGVDGRMDDLQHHGAIRRVHRGADAQNVALILHSNLMNQLHNTAIPDLLQDLQHVFQSPMVGTGDHCGMNLLFQELFSYRQKLSSCSQTHVVSIIVFLTG